METIRIQTFEYNLESTSRYFDAQRGVERSGLSEQSTGLTTSCRGRSGDRRSDRSHVLQQLFQFRNYFRKIAARCKKLKQFADSPIDESKFESGFVSEFVPGEYLRTISESVSRFVSGFVSMFHSGLERQPKNTLQVHDSTNRQNAVSGSETKFFLDTIGQRNYNDRKFSGDNSVATTSARSSSAVSAFFHLRPAGQVDAELSPFRFESLGGGRRVPCAHYFVRLNKAESRRRRQSELSANINELRTWSVLAAFL